jgi:hypothetical protein
MVARLFKHEIDERLIFPTLSTISWSCSYITGESFNTNKKKPGTAVCMLL